MDILASHILFIGRGAILTLELLIGSWLMGIFFGIFLSILRRYAWLSLIVNQWISVIRGTPVILQLSFVYFIVPELMGIKLSVLSAGIWTFGLNSAAYIAEIFRSGIESLPRGQFEAAQSLEIKPFYMWKDIILPQVVARVFPSLANEFIALLKETALIGTISGMDTMRMAQILGAEQFTYFAPLCIAAAYYYGLVWVIERWVKVIENRKRWIC